MSTNYQFMTESPQTVLQVNDTVTSPLGLYVLTLATDGLKVTPGGGGTAEYIASVVNAKTCKLMGQKLTIWGGASGTTELWTSPSVSFTIKGLDMQDDG